MTTISEAIAASQQVTAYLLSLREDDPLPAPIPDIIDTIELDLPDLPDLPDIIIEDLGDIEPPEPAAPQEQPMPGQSEFVTTVAQFVAAFISPDVDVIDASGLDDTVKLQRPLRAGGRAKWIDGGPTGVTITGDGLWAEDMDSFEIRRVEVKDVPGRGPQTGSGMIINRVSYVHVDQCTIGPNLNDEGILLSNWPGQYHKMECHITRCILNGGSGRNLFATILPGDPAKSQDDDFSRWGDMIRVTVWRNIFVGNWRNPLLRGVSAAVVDNLWDRDGWSNWQPPLTAAWPRQEDGGDARVFGESWFVGFDSLVVNPRHEGGRSTLSSIHLDGSLPYWYNDDHYPIGASREVIIAEAGRYGAMTLPPPPADDDQTGTGPPPGDNYGHMEDVGPRKFQGHTIPIGIRLDPGDDYQRKVDEGVDAGTRNFIITEGVHEGFSLQLDRIRHDDTRFIGLDAKLDGQGQTTYAFHGNASNVTIGGGALRGPLEVYGYNNPVQHGAIHAQLFASEPTPEPNQAKGWLIQYVDVHHNRGAGVLVGPGGWLLDFRIHHNGQLGFTTHGADGCEIAYGEVWANNTDGHDPWWEAGASKLKYTSRAHVHHLHIHDDAYGIWLDIDNGANGLNIVEENLIERCTHMGIFNEISFDCVIRYNTVLECGFGMPVDFLWGAGIASSTSTGTHIYRNYVAECAEGIGFIDQNRGEGRTAGPWVTEDCSAFNNCIEDCGQSGIAISGPGDPFEGDPAAEGEVTWENNMYVLDDFPERGSEYTDIYEAQPFRLGTSSITKEQWKNRVEPTAVFA
jgi:hypothetical protein